MSSDFQDQKKNGFPYIRLGVYKGDAKNWPLLHFWLTDKTHEVNAYSDHVPLFSRACVSEIVISEITERISIKFGTGGEGLLSNLSENIILVVSVCYNLHQVKSKLQIWWN
jgi:hypothetical protein